MATKKESTKQRRESKLLLELQRDHGYMFAEMPRERDRYTTQVRGLRPGGRVVMTPARVLRVIVPDGSWLVSRAIDAEKRKPHPARRPARKKVNHA